MHFVFLLLSLFSLVFGQSTTGCATYTASTRILTGTVRDVWGCADPNLPNADVKAASDYYACGAELANGEPVPPCANGGYFECAQDFERYNGNDQGICQRNLDSENLPVFDTTGNNPSVMNPGQFYYWYRNKQGYNIPFSVNLTASNQGTCNSRVYGYDNSNFYPVDRRGFGNFYNNRNYGFTYDMHLRFTYQGDEFYSFVGDDDIFVFLNGRLALDLGGVHGAQNGELDLKYPTSGCSGYTIPNPRPICSTRNGPATDIPCACVLGMIPGNSYSFDFFYNERHTSASTMKFSTSLILQCPYYDYCGTCQGDGQSCCNCPSRSCNTHRCHYLNGTCLYTPISCPAAPNKCTSSFCNSQSGQCDTAPVNCNDNNMCTIDTCDNNLGCQRRQVNCNDNDPCTTDTCSPSTGCQNVLIPGCTLCTGVNCQTVDACTINECNPANGLCQRRNVTCNDDNMCTTDSCHPVNGCQYTSVICSDNNKCTVDMCNTTSGCYYVPVQCSDGNLCTDDLCDTVTGNCTFPTKSLPTSDKCNGVYCDSRVGVVTVPTECPESCKGCDPISGCTDCPGDFGTTEQVATGLGAGALAGIVIGVVAFAAAGGFGAKKGFDAFKTNKIARGDIKDNPLYEKKRKSGRNPLYEGKNDLELNAS